MAKARAARGKKTKASAKIVTKLTLKQSNYLRAVSEDAPSKLRLFERVYLTKTPSKAAAIKAACLECTWFDIRAITECTSSQCPLWRLRPYQKGDNQ
jgi:hypothetical protein